MMPRIMKDKLNLSSTTRKVALVGLLAALALVLSWLESMLPPPPYAAARRKAWPFQYRHDVCGRGGWSVARDGDRPAKRRVFPA